ncbi:unnamed protein product, partial [Rotaria sordida]
MVILPVPISFGIGGVGI